MAREKKSTELMNMTSGPIRKQILSFALPLLASSLVQQLYNTVDILYLGNAVGKNQTAAVGASTMLVTCLIGLFGGLSIGCSVVTARHFGAGDRKRVRDTIQSAAAISLIGGVVVMILGMLLAPAFIAVIGSPAEIVEDAIAYLRIYFLSTLFIVSYNMSAGILRALGNASATLRIQLIGGLTNVVMDGFFVLYLHMEVRGVAWATLFSQGVAAILMVIMVFRLPEDVRLNVRAIRIHKDLFREILRIGIPAGLQTLLIAVSNVIAQYHINSLGTDAITAMTLYLKVELPIYLPIVAIGSAATTFVGQNVGALDHKRAYEGLKTCLALCVSLTVVTSGLLLLFGAQAFGLFNKDPGVISAGLRVIHTSFPFYFLYAVLQVYGDSIRGAGNSRAPMLIIMANITILRAALMSILVPRTMDIRSVAVAYPITWFTAAVCMVIYFYKKQKIR